MPYTLSHAVIALPVSRVFKHIPVASMVVGSFSPGLPYLLYLTPTKAPGHSLLGVLFYDLAPSLLLLLVWYRWLEKPLLELFHLPLPQRGQYTGRRFLLLAMLGILIGAYSHALWDATSHSYGKFVVASEFWHQTLFSLPLYKWNQYITGLVGLAILLLWYICALIKNRSQPYQGKLATGIIILSGHMCLFVALANIIHSSNSLSEYAVRSAIGLMVGAATGACFYTYWIQRP